MNIPPELASVLARSPAAVGALYIAFDSTPVGGRANPPLAAETVLAVDDFPKPGVWPAGFDRTWEQRSEMRRSRLGFGPVTYEVYQLDTELRRLPVWFVVTISTGFKAGGSPVVLDLYDLGVQGRGHRLFVRAKDPATAEFRLTQNNVQTEPQRTPQSRFYIIPGSGWEEGSDSHYRVTLAEVSASAPTIELECMYYDFPTSRLTGTRQVDDGAPPPSRPGHNH